MPRNMSFMLTQTQIRNQTKTVTRRIGWKFLKPGDILNACVKCQGLKKGEKIEKICQIRVVGVRREKLLRIDRNDCTLEGFPRLQKWAFINMFCEQIGGDSTQIITRIEFEYLRG